MTERERCEQILKSFTCAKSAHQPKTRRLNDASSGQNAILMNLYFSENKSMSPSELSSLLNVGPSRITKAVDLLESKGLLERIQNKDDRRNKLIALTRSGEEKAKANYESMIDLLARFRERFGADRVESLLKEIEEAKHVLWQIHKEKEA